MARVTGREPVTVTLRGGVIVSSRTDRNGLKVNVEGNGFFVWVNAGSPDVTVERLPASEASDDG